MVLYNKLFLLIVIIYLFAGTALPVCAHDVSMGGSDWSFGKNSIKATIELNITLLQQIQEINEKQINLEKCTNSQLQQIAEELIQPYINKKLSIWVNNKQYPIKVLNLVMEDNYYYSIQLAADDINFKDPSNQVKIEYMLLFEETNGVHINIANIHLSDVATDIEQTIFESDTPTWEGSVKKPTAVNNGSNNSNDTGIAQNTESKASETVKKSDAPAMNSDVKNSSDLQNSAAIKPEDAQGKQTLMFFIKRIFNVYAKIVFLLAITSVILCFFTRIKKRKKLK
jgi:hypothetical protein